MRSFVYIIAEWAPVPFKPGRQHGNMRKGAGFGNFTAVTGLQIGPGTPI
jgi:hypothetical protein